MKFITAIALLFIVLPSTFSQRTYIPDTAFEEALIFEGLDDVLDDSITTSAIDTLTYLDLEPFGITDLTGIEAFLALKIFVVRNNNLTQLDLSNNHFLEFLNCEGNQITDLNITSNTVLKQLFADHNNLTSIDLTQNPLLEVLDLTQNGIGAFDLSQNPLLKTIILRNTTIQSIDLSNNDLLEDIDVSVNQLSEIDVSNMPNLITLLVYANAITAINVDNNPALETLFVMGNQVAHLDLTNNPLLTYIACYNNNLSTLILPPIDTLSTEDHALGSGNNVNLTCIQCDNPAYVLAHWTTVIDSISTLSPDCGFSSDIEDITTSLLIYPNPAHHQLSIHSNDDGAYNILDINGRLIDNGLLIQGENLIDISSFGQGVYFLRLKQNNQWLTRKIVIE